jgi:hypothetical protein
MTHFLFISRTIEADSGTQGYGTHNWESEPILASLSVSLLPLMAQWSGTQNNLTLLLLERSCRDNQHLCRSLDEIVYEYRANNAVLLSEPIQYTHRHVVHVRAPTVVRTGDNCIYLCLEDRCKWVKCIRFPYIYGIRKHPSTRPVFAKWTVRVENHTIWLQDFRRFLAIPLYDC